MTLLIISSFQDIWYLAEYAFLLYVVVITTAKPVVNWHSLPTSVEVYTLVPFLIG